MTNIQNDENKVSTILDSKKRRVENVQNHPEMELFNKYSLQKKEESFLGCMINDDKLTNIEMMFWDLYGSLMELSLKL